MSQTDSLEERLRVSFKDPSLLRLALTHRSYANEARSPVAESNERLEFLGDALIGLAVAREVYERYPDRPEGELTALRSALVRGETLARIADSVELGRHLIMGKGEEASGGRGRPSNLATAFEALVGALLLDSGYGVAAAFVIRAASDEMLAADRRRDHKSSKSLLQELVQRGSVAGPSYRVVEVSGEDHTRLFTVEVSVAGEVVGRGMGPRKALAEAEAANEALRAMGHDL